MCNISRFLLTDFWCFCLEKSLKFSWSLGICLKYPFILCPLLSSPPCTSSHLSSSPTVSSCSTPCPRTRRCPDPIPVKKTPPKSPSMVSLRAPGTSWDCRRTEHPLWDWRCDWSTNDLIFIILTRMFLVHSVLVALIIIILVITSLNDVTSFFF